MAAPKIKMADVARLSGVSRATVDRVLNQRPGVRAQTVEKVERALKELGYASSALQALDQPLHGNLHVLCPAGTNPFFDVIAASVTKALSAPDSASINAAIVPFDPYTPQTLVAALDAVPATADGVILVGCDMPVVARAINGLTERGTRVVTMISDVPQSRRTTFVGQDNFAAGRTAARLMAGFVPPGPGKVGIFVGHYHFRHLMDRMAGFRQTLGLLRPDIGILQPTPYEGATYKATAAISELDAAGDALRGAYLTGGGQPTILHALADGAHEDLVVLGHEISEQSRAALLDGRFTAILCSDVDSVVDRAVAAALNPTADLTLPPCPINVIFPENLPG